MEIRNVQTGEYKLTIQNCNELDKGTYFLLAACSRDMEVKSNMIKLDFVKGITLFTSNNITHFKI